MNNCDECGEVGAYQRVPHDPRQLCDRCHFGEQLERWYDILWQVNYARV